MKDEKLLRELQTESVQVHRRLRLKRASSNEPKVHSKRQILRDSIEPVSSKEVIDLTKEALDSSDSDSCIDDASDSWIKQDLDEDSRWTWSSNPSDTISDRVGSGLTKALDDEIALNRITTVEGLAKAWKRSDFFTRARQRYLDWSWRCGLESESEVLTAKGLEKLILQAADQTPLPRVQRTDAEYAMCWACRNYRPLTLELLWPDQPPRYLGADCGKKLKGVIGFVRDLSILIDAMRKDQGIGEARTALLTRLDTIGGAQHNLFKKYAD